MTKRRQVNEKQVSEDEGAVLLTGVQSGTARRLGCSETSDWKFAEKYEEEVKEIDNGSSLTFGWRETLIEPQNDRVGSRYYNDADSC